MVAPIANLWDDFNDGVINTSKWTVLSGVWSESTGTMCGPTSAGGFFDMRSTASWSLQQSSAFLELTNLAGGAGASYVEFRYRIRNSADATDYVEFLVAPLAPTIQMRWVENNVQQASSTIAFNATTMRWLRIREYTNLVLFETSPDGAVWTTQFTTTSQSWVSSTQAYFATFQTGGAAGTVCFDNFNLAPASARSVPVGSEFDVSDDGKLGLNRCDQADEAWPFSCSVSAYNALRRSENPCGHWVQPPAKQYLDVEAVVRSTSDQDEQTIITLELTNPDTCRAMKFYLPLIAGMKMVQPTTTDTGIFSWTLGVQVSGVDNPDSGFQPLTANDFGNLPQAHFWRGTADYYWTADPGATTTIEVVIKVFAGGGEADLTQIQARLGIIGMSEVLA